MRFKVAVWILILAAAVMLGGCGGVQEGIQGDPSTSRSRGPAGTIAPSEPQLSPPPASEQESPAPAEREPVLMGEFSTRIVDNDESRVKNLYLACSKLNGKITAPGEIFSFNDTVGPRTEERGFEYGYVFEGSKKKQEVGGGVCQVSSTLFNAARQAGMEIVERHQHKRKVDYVKLGNDATVSYGELDFRFKNVSDYPVKIEAGVLSGRVVVRLWGI